MPGGVRHEGIARDPHASADQRLQLDAFARGQRDLGDERIVDPLRAARRIEAKDVRARLSARRMLELAIDEHAALERDVCAALVGIDLDAGGARGRPCTRRGAREGARRGDRDLVDRLRADRSGDRDRHRASAPARGGRGFTPACESNETGSRREHGGLQVHRRACPVNARPCRSDSLVRAQQPPGPHDAPSAAGPGSAARSARARAIAPTSTSAGCAPDTA